MKLAGRGPRLALWGGLKVAATLAVAVILLAVLVLPRLAAVVGRGRKEPFDPRRGNRKAAVDQAGRCVLVASGPSRLVPAHLH